MSQQQGRGGTRVGRGRGGPQFNWVCPSGHKLEVPEEEIFTCDVCGQDYEDEDPALSCEDCEFDVCRKCRRNPPSAGEYEKILAKIRPQEVKNKDKRNQPPRLFFSAHGDTNFMDSSCCHRITPQNPIAENDFLYFAHVDNFAGVFAMMQAYFSGRIVGRRVSCQVTYGEEGEIDGIDFHGARALGATLRRIDCVFALDVTAKPHPTPVSNADIFEPRNAPPQEGELSIEKMKHNQNMLDFLVAALGEPATINGEVNPRAALGPSHVKWHAYDDCPDPQCNEDESDIYSKYVNHACFLGLFTNAGRIACSDEQLSLLPPGAPAIMETDGDYNEGEVFCWRRDIDAVTKAVVLLSEAFERGVYDKIIGYEPKPKGGKKAAAAAAASSSAAATSAD